MTFLVTIIVLALVLGIYSTVMLSVPRPAFQWFSVAVAFASTTVLIICTVYAFSYAAKHKDVIICQDTAVSSCNAFKNVEIINTTGGIIKFRSGDNEFSINGKITNF